MNNCIEHFNKEWLRLKDFYKDTADLRVYQAFKPLIEKMLEVWHKQGHSGFSAHFFAPRIARMLQSAMLLSLLIPIRNEEEFDFYWVTKSLLQSRALSGVFKEKNGKIYYSRAIIWDDGEATFRRRIYLSGYGMVSSRAYIKKYPFSPKTFTVQVTFSKNMYTLTPEGAIEFGKAQAYYDLEIEK